MMALSEDKPKTGKVFIESLPRYSEPSQTDKVRRQAYRELLLIESGRVSIVEVDEIITIRACSSRHDAHNVKQQSCGGSLRQ